MQFWALCAILHKSNLLEYENLRIVAVFDWEWSTIVPLQLSCLPPVCLATVAIARLARNEGLEDFIGVVEIFLDCCEE